jgi:hypothetical protein
MTGLLIFVLTGVLIGSIGFVGGALCGIAGMIIGVGVGTLAYALCAVSARSDRHIPGG